MPQKTVKIDELNAQRKRAVQLRLNGATLAAVRDEVGLSTPTIVSAVKAFESGGWPAVNVKPRGRPHRQSANGLSDHELKDALKRAMQPDNGSNKLWSTKAVADWLETECKLSVSTQTAASYLNKWHISMPNMAKTAQQREDEESKRWLSNTYKDFCSQAKNTGKTILWIGITAFEDGSYLIYTHTLRGRCYWQLCTAQPTTDDYKLFFDALKMTHPRGLALVLPNHYLTRDARLGAHIEALSSIFISASANKPEQTDSSDLPNRTKAENGHNMSNPKPNCNTGTRPAANDAKKADPKIGSSGLAANNSCALPNEAQSLTHLQRLEAESIQILREVVAEANNPVMLYSIGKDSAVMLHLARKAFFPAPPPFPLLHVDTRWKFQAMYEFRDNIAKEYGMELLTHTNPEGIEKEVNPFTHGSALHTDIMKTEALKQALDKHGFDVALGGARRDEEKSRAKERVFSFRTAQHRWEPKNQRPELWNLYNSRKHNGETIRAFPVSNWTELDIWQYIHLQNIPIVPLYLAAKRPVVERDGMLVMVDDDRMPLKDGEVPMMRNVRFRTLGCYPLTGAVESEATTLPEIIQEMLLTKTSERQGRLIDHDSAASMEKKKQEGYF